ncbi:MAG: hypothetical protein U5K70_03930 [Halodesulfurarchaeum sp.]|nr:hypothetical protein [Halodesulfurarchaeum sp.]
MELTVSLSLGRLNVELAGEDREEVQEELINFISFIEENEDILEGYASQESSNTAENVSVPETDDTSDRPTQGSGPRFGDIPDKTGIDNAVLNQYFDVNPDGDEPPSLNFEVDVLGESGSGRSEMQMRASLIFFTLWRECMGIESVMSPELKDALRISGIDDSSLYNMYYFNEGEGDQYFRREGTGEHTAIELTLPGRREGCDQIARTVDRLESNED